MSAAVAGIVNGSARVKYVGEITYAEVVIMGADRVGLWLFTRIGCEIFVPWHRIAEVEISR